MHLAQLNIVEARFPVESEVMLPFTSRLVTIQDLADRSNGFVWRDLSDGEDADFSNLAEAKNSHGVLANLTVWDSLEALFAFTYKTAHAKVMQANKDNFFKFSEVNFVLWWIPEGHQPTGQEAKKRLIYLRKHGSSPEAFTFRLPFNQDGNPITPNFPQKDCA